MIEVELPDGTIAEFPDGTPREAMQAAIQKRFPPKSAGPSITVGDRKIPMAEYQAMSDAERQAIRDQIARANPEAQTQSSILDPFVQGTTFGWGDELRGVVQGGIAAAQGGDFGETYRNTVDESRNALAQERRVNPVGSLAAEVAGAIPTGMVAGGQLAGRGATLAGRMVSTGLVGAGQGAAYGAGAADDNIGERAKSAALGGLVGGGVGAAIPAVGNAVSSALRRNQQGAVLNAAAKAAPSADDLKSVASTLFEQATGGTPIAISDHAYMRFLGGVQNTARKLRINQALDPKSVGLSELMMSIADDLAKGGTVVDLKDLHIVRQAAQRVAVSSEGRDAAFANTVIRQLDDFIQQLKPADILGGTDPSQATGSLFKGISTWARANKVSLVEEAIRKGQSAASGPEKGTRNALRTMIFNKPDVWRRFNAAEQQAIKDVIEGTGKTNLLKLLGTFGFGGNTATNGVGGAIGMAMGQAAYGPVGMVVGPALGSVARAASDKATEGLANRALGAVASENLRVLPAINPNQATPIEVLLRRSLTPNAGGLVAPR